MTFDMCREKNSVDDNNRKKYQPTHFLRSSIDLEKLFKDIPEALENNYNFPKRFSFKPKKTKPKLPSLILQKNNSVEKELLIQAKHGLENRLKTSFYQNMKIRIMKKNQKNLW